MSAKTITPQRSLSPWRNPHSARGAAALANTRFRALALFGRRPPERAEGSVMPASENLRKTRLMHRNKQPRRLVHTTFGLIA